jgi:NADPH:quinone reductase-like Zn-dependent oxidoreductase
MKAIILPDYNANIVRAMRSLQVADTETPEPINKQVLIKVSGTPCNPSDIAFMRGGYAIRKPVPVTMGFECTGTVVKTGDHPEAARLLGRKVSCFARENDSGTWAEYFLTDYPNCLPVRDDLDEEQAAMLCINPFTAYVLFYMALEKNTGAIIQNGASGQIGAFIRALAKKNDLQVINLVRKDEHISELQSQGENHVLNINDDLFESKLQELSAMLQATVALDAVGGDLSGKMVNAMPPGSELIIYGGLSGKPVGQVNPMEVIFKDKSIRGFNLGAWKQEVGDKQYFKIADEIQDLIKENVLYAKIQSTYKLEEVQTALEKYIRNMSSGKILFRP